MKLMVIQVKTGPSAKRIDFTIATLLMSFIKTLNKRGPSTEPCGTPTVVMQSKKHVLFFMKKIKIKKNIQKTGF